MSGFVWADCGLYGGIAEGRMDRRGAAEGSLLTGP